VFKHAVGFGAPIGAAGKTRCAAGAEYTPASARSATKAWRSAVPLADQGVRPASCTVTATSRTSSLRRRPCSMTRWKKYAACFSQSMPGKVSCSDAISASSTP
jgi:hypothetical protein